MAQIRDVSKLAGVSPATVSRAFTDPGKLSEATLQRVMQAAEKLNYKPNSLARLFRGKRTMSVLVMVPDLANALFARTLSGIERAAARNNYFLLVSDTRDDPEIEMAGVELVETQRADGVIQLGERPLAELASERAAPSIPFVQVFETAKAGAYPTVEIDNHGAARAMAEYVLALGHRRIGVVAGLQDRKVTETRLRGFREAFAGFGTKLPDSAVEYGPYSLSGGAQSALRLLSRHPEVTALLCMSDDIAIGAMRTALELGRKLPEDLSVTGFDDLEVGSYFAPTLTTVHQPAARMGEVAMTLMCSWLAGETVRSGGHTLATELVIRGSTRRLS